MKNRWNLFYMCRTISVFVLMSIIVTSLSGCEPFRKKFVRQKKGDKAKKGFQPILQPEEYPAVVRSSAERYRYHYSMWKVWSKDLEKALRLKENDKRTLNMINEIMVHFEQMKMYIPQSKQADLMRAANDIEKIRSAFDKEPIFRSYSSLRNLLNRSSKFVRSHLSPDDVFGSNEGD